MTARLLYLYNFLFIELLLALRLSIRRLENLVRPVFDARDLGASLTGRATRRNASEHEPYITPFGKLT